MNKRTVLSLFALAFLATFIGCAPPRPKFELKLPERHATLPNGMRVIVLPDTTTELVEVDVRWEVGSIEDFDGKAGLAHLVEHMNFQQRPAGPDQPPIFQVLKNVATFFNAFTKEETTHYMAMGKKEMLEQLIAIDASRINLGCKTIPEVEFVRERDVVRNEIRRSWSSPEGQIPYLLLDDIYGKNHAYGRDIGGDDQQIHAITMDDVCRFMDQYYVPERATMIIAGNTTEEEVLKLVAKWLAPLPKRTPAPRRTVDALNLTHKVFTHELNVEQTSVFVSWKLPPKYSEDDLAGRFLIAAVTGKTGFFGDTYDFATGVSGFALGGERAPVFVLEVDLRDSDAVDEALDAIWKSARSAHRNFEKGDDFEDWRARVVGSIVSAFESLTTRTLLFGDYAQFDKSGKFFAGELERFKAVKGERIRDLIKETMDPDKAVVMVVKAKKGVAGGYKQLKHKYTPPNDYDDKGSNFHVQAGDAKVPLAVPEHRSVLAKARRFALGNGMKVVLLPEATSLPVVSMTLVFNAGASLEGAKLAGLAELAAGYLEPPFVDSGAGGVPQTANVLGKVGALVYGAADTDFTEFHVTGLNLYLDIMVKGLERFIKAGDYFQESIEGYQKYFGYALKRKSFLRDILFGHKLNGAIYGPDHPYTATGIPTSESIGRLGRDLAYSFKSDHYTAKNATLVVAGSFDDKEVEARIRETFGEWSTGGADHPAIVPAYQRTAPVYFGIDDEENPNVDFRIAYPIAAPMDGQRAARLVLAEMLNDRMSAVREKLGASYGTYAGASVHRGPGMFAMGGMVDAEKATESLKAMREGVDGLRKGDGFDEDFVRARQVVLHDLVTTKNDSRTLADQLATIAEYELTLDYYDKLIRQVAALSPAQVHALIAAELVPALEVIVAQGPREAMTKAFEGNGIQGVEFASVK